MCVCEWGKDQDAQVPVATIRATDPLAAEVARFWAVREPNAAKARNLMAFALDSEHVREWRARQETERRPVNSVA